MNEKIKALGFELVGESHYPIGLNIEEMEAFLEKMKEMRGKE